MRICMMLSVVFSSFALASGDPSDLDSESASTHQGLDPVVMAEHLIRSGGPLWSPLGHRVMLMKYTAGRYMAQHGFGYILLQSPKLAASLVTEGWSGVASTVSRDLALEILEKSIGSPAELCEEICNAAITQGLEEYETAFGIARDYIESGTISQEDAVRFLNSRWGIFRLAYAEALYNDVVSFDYSVCEQVGGVVAERITEELIEEYQLRLGSASPLPLGEFAFFLGDLIDVLEESQIGIMSYQPYVDYVERMEALNQQALIEMEHVSRYIYTPDEEDVRSAIVESAERAVRAWPFVSPVDFHSSNDRNTGVQVQDAADLIPLMGSEVPNSSSEFYDPGIQYFVDRYPYVAEQYLIQLYNSERDEVSENWDTLYSDYYESPAALVSIESHEFDLYDVRRLGGGPDQGSVYIAQASVAFTCVRETSWGRFSTIETVAMAGDYFRADQADAWKCMEYSVAEIVDSGDRFIQVSDRLRKLPHQEYT